MNLGDSNMSLNTSYEVQSTFRTPYFVVRNLIKLFSFLEDDNRCVVKE